ncbi:MAG: GntR family transcriptional regulator [Firmicutes bacterium]|nr:GntR family transcriptional regulator [Bacillota bacterium]
MADFIDTSHKTLAVRIADRLRSEILSKKIDTGTRITAKEIADQWNTSQVPVREAFSILAGEGLLEINPYRGAIVKTMSQESINEINDIVGAMEVLLCLRCLKIGYSEELINNLVSINRELEEFAVRLPDDNDFWLGEPSEEDIKNAVIRVETNIRFHRAMYSIDKGSEIYRLYEIYVARLEAVRHYYAMPKKRVIETVQEHYMLIDAIKANDPAELERVMNLHSQNSRIRFEIYKGSKV